MKKTIAINKIELKESFIKSLKSLKVILAENHVAQLIQYIELLCKWNQTYNLVATHNPAEILQQHILDSLSIINYIEGQNIIDIGTGAGLPGIPLAIALPRKQFTLLDSIGKKTRFLQQVQGELGLENITVVESRAENFKPTACFDNVVSRAVTTAVEMLTLSRHLLCTNGKILLMKGPNVQEELTDLNCKYEIVPLAVPGLNKERCLVILSPS